MGDQSLRKVYSSYRAEGYADGLAGKPMRIAWGTMGKVGHLYGMGYFHGRAHATLKR